MRSVDGETLYPETIAIPAGASIKISPIAGQLSTLLKYPPESSGSLSITNIVDSTGSSNAIAQRYILGVGEILSFDSTGPFYLTATGSTVVCQMLRIRTSGTGN
jgi:hypothetical protein